MSKTVGFLEIFFNEMRLKTAGRHKEMGRGGETVNHRQTDRDRDRQTERETDTERLTDRQTDTEPEPKSERDRQTETHTKTYTDIQGGRQRDRQRQREEEEISECGRMVFRALGCLQKSIRDGAP